MKLLIKNLMILTMESREKIINKGYIIIEDNKILEVSSGEYERPLNFEKVIDGKNHLAMPGLVNGHTHAAMTLLRGYGEGLPLMRWLNEKIWPMEAKFKEEHIRMGTSLAAIEMLRTGTTTFNDMYYYEDVVGEVCTHSNIRGVLGIPLIGENFENQLKEALTLNKTIMENNKGNGLITTSIAPHSPYTLSFEALKMAGDTARLSNLLLHIHIAETKEEVSIIYEKSGKTPCEYLEDTGIFNNKVVAAHCVHLTDKDIEILKRYDTSVVYNPQSNMKLSSGTCRVIDLQNGGINVALGTDGASSNNNLNLFEEMETGALLQKLASKDPVTMDPFEVLAMATVKGAQALKIENLGLIKEGYLADIILLDLQRPSMVPLYDPYANLVFSASGSEVDYVIVNGEVVMEKGEFTKIDQEKILFQCNKLCATLV